MAYAAVTSLLSTLEQLLQPDPSPIHPKRRNEIEPVFKKASFLQSFLEDSGRECSNHEDMIHLERCIRDVSYRAEDFFEELMFDYSVDSGSKKLISCTNCWTGKVSKKKIQSIDAVITRIYDKAHAIKVLQAKDDFPLSQGTLSSSSSDLISVKDDVVVGLDGDFIRIADQLTGHPSKLVVVTIFGMGGIGKTTLAKKLYDDPLMVYHFYIRAWITVSQQYRVRDLLLGLLRYVTQINSKMHGKSDEELAEKLYKSLKGKRYLIVMDDVWSIKAWEDVKRYLPDDNNGSRIVVTSRLMKVALFVNPYNPPNQMRFLSVKESWNLLQKKVLGGRPCTSRELARIGVEIAEKCLGLPLAIVVVSGILSKISVTPTSWRSVARSVRSLVTRNSSQCSDILALSYNHLPHHLKACFLYMGGFPEDVEIPVWRLLRLWLAEGFVKSKTQNTLEQVAEEYLQDLIDRCLIMVVKKSSNGRAKTCSIHDLLRDFCLEEAEKEKLLHVVRRYEAKFPQGVHRRLHFHSDIFAYAPYAYLNPHVRSFLSSKASSLLLDSFFPCMGFKLLRVLDMANHFFHYFPIQVTELVHLRYIALSVHSGFPRSMFKLKNLQTLIIYWAGWESHTLPLEIWMMQQLRHAHFKAQVVYLVDPFVTDDGKRLQVLDNLQTLSKISSADFSPGLISRVPNLKTLTILETEENNFSGDWPCNALNNLAGLCHLESLKLFFDPNENFRPRCIRHWNAFPLNLNKLTLSGSRLPWENARILGMLPNLEVLKLKRYAFQGPEWEPEEEGFSRLKFLFLECRDLVHWRATDYHFPSLASLVLKFCYQLKEIPCEIGDIPTLQIIKLHSCGPFAEISARRIRGQQESLGNNGLEVRIDQSR